MSVTMCVYADQMISAHIINLTIGIGGREHSLMWLPRYHHTTHREHIYSWMPQQLIVTRGCNITGPITDTLVCGESCYSCMWPKTTAYRTLPARER